ncbi:protein furry isoform X4 [Zerene cesonia]|uniref:protein furry isoform X4 n=1 Tax=Zerene cesonia TaxID=33412 RepID=UPI0018E52BE2|nr:protein furry isoform X4 [Zerene cesonia]XP_038216905.1 protein furry isoform X4 [Zerene cesonia]
MMRNWITSSNAIKASGTEEAPSSMVSSEAESEGSVLSEHRHDVVDGHAPNSDTSSELGPHSQDKTLAPSIDIRNTGNSIASYISSRGSMLPWGQYKGPTLAPPDSDLRPGEFVMRLLFTEFTVQAERKMEAVMSEPLEKPLNKTLQRGEDPQLDQILSAFGTVAEHCLPSLLRALFGWLERQMADSPQLSEQAKKPQQDLRNKSIIYIVSGSGAGTEQVERSCEELHAERRDLAVEFLFCLALIEVLKQLPFHPGHEDLVQYIENVAFKRFNYKEGLQSNPNAANVHIIADLYAEVIGVLAQSRFASVRKRFTAELKELKSREPSPHATQSIISLLMGMKFFRVKMVPIEEFEASFQFLTECAQYFLEVKDKDIRHALAGLFVEILVPVAATVKNEVNVPCLKNFVEMLYSHTLDASTKSKHRLALFPLVTCLLCVSQKQFFLANWHCFLAMCLSHLKNRDPKMCRVALESLYRLLWVYMIRIKCESNSATQSRLQSIVNSLFPKGSKGVVPRDTPLNIFVKIIQFIAQERLDFAMREIVFDLLMVGRPIKIILTPERMSIGLRAFLVVADSLQQKEGEPPMPRTSGTLPSGNTLRVKKTFLNKMLTDETAQSIGMSAYFPYVRRVLVEILRALDAHYGRPLMLTNTQNVTKEQEINTGERKPRIDLFRTCVAAIPRLIPEGMSPSELVDLLCRLTVHMDEELRGLSFQSLQTLIVDFPEWRQDVLAGFTQFLAKEVQDTSPQLVENGLRMLLQLITSWKNGEPASSAPPKLEPLASVIRGAEALGLVMLCQCKAYPRRLAVHILRESKCLLERLQLTGEEPALIDAADTHVAHFAERCAGLLPPTEKQALLAAGQPDLVWLVERTHPVWTAGLQHDETSSKNSWSGSSTNGADPWEVILFGLLEKNRVPAKCPTTVLQAWPILHARIHALYTIIEPAPVNDNRASLLSRGPALPRKPEKERDGYMQVWKYYLTMAYLVVPAVPSPVVRCASPDLSLSTEGEGWLGTQLTSSTESLNAPVGFFTLPLSYARAHRHHKRTSSSPDSLSERSGGEARGAQATPGSLHKLAVPLARCEVSEVRDAAVAACGHINPDALKDLFEELVPLLREAVDRKQENMRRRRRRDALRLHLNKMLLIIAQRKTFAISPFALEGGGLHPALTEYLEGVRQSLEVEAEKDAPAAREQRLTFADFVTELIKSFPLEMYGTLVKRELCKSLFSLFAGWCGPLGKHLGALVPQPPAPELDERLNVAALKAMSALVCCGPCFAPNALAEDGSLYPWLSEMLSSTNDKIYELARETIVLLLDCNPDIGPLLDWTVDKCFTGPPRVADGCFMALATIFSAREYPCDHYTAIINVTLMCTGCPRAPVHESALQLLQLLDKRFFGAVGPLPTDDDASEKGRGTLDVLLCTTYCRSQLYLSRQLSQLHPELTMPMFSEITARFQTARTEVRQLLLQYLLPWLVNIELLDPNVPPANPLSYIQYYGAEGGRGARREGLGSVEATEMVLNNLFYITVKFSDQHPKEIEELWSTLCACWPNNLKVIIRYLIIVSGMAPNELLPYAKRVVLYLARSRPERLLDEMMTELQTVETLNCLIERTETPPFYRLTSMRKATSGHSDPGTGSQDATGRTCDLAPVEKGTIHTKRHSGEDPAKAASVKSEPLGRDKRASAPPCPTPPADEEPSPPSDGDATPTGICPEVGICLSGPATPQEARVDAPQPRPLPMPEYGGFFALLTEYLPDTSQPVSGFHRCNVAVMLLCDVVLDGVELDWSIHVPLMLHIVFLGMDHTRWLVHQHCRQLLLNLLVAVAAHHDHLTVARVLLAARSAHLGMPLPPPALPLTPRNFTEPDAVFDTHTQCAHSPRTHVRSLSSDPQVTPEAEGDTYPSLPVIVTNEEGREPGAEEHEREAAELPVADAIKSLVHFLASRPSHMPLWQYEDITAKVWSLRSCQQMAALLSHVLRIFRESLPHALISERWAQTALQLGLSCPSRHYAGRSLQVFRFIGVAMTGRMVSDILSRLVETVAEQGEDMQGYVTELLLTLEAAVDSLESNFRPLDYMRDIFKSTPNLNNKEGQQPNGNVYSAGKRSPGVCVGCVNNHTRSTSYSVSYCVRKSNAPPSGHSDKQSHESRTRPCSEAAKGGCSNLCRSRSAQSLKLLGDTATQDDKLTILATVFWVGASVLESDYEHEFLLGVRLLARVMARLPLDRPDARERLDRTQVHAPHPPTSLHALLLKGCTHPNTYEPVVGVLVDMIPLLELPVIDPTQSLAFPMTVVALLPYMLLHYEDANELCVRAACHIAQFTAEKSKKLENLGTVMTLYSRRTFSKESFQWTKCVVKYLWDTYSHLSLQMLAFLVEVLEKGAANLQLPVLSILHCMLYYVELNAPAAQPVNADLLRAVAKFIDQEGNNYKEAMKILKLVVTRCSTLVVPPHWEHAASALDPLIHKKELPGRTMDFTFDLSQTPVIGRKYLPKGGSQPPTGPSSLSNASSTTPDKGSSTGSASTVVGAEAAQPAAAAPHSAASPRRSLSLSPADALASGWKRPWMSQSRVRECLVNLLTTCGQRVGLPKSPSDDLLTTLCSKVIFSQSSELLERESSMASSLEEVSGTPGNEPSGGAPPTDHFGVFKDFDFLEYESESIEGESSDNFNWGVRRRLPSEEREDGIARERSAPAHELAERHQHRPAGHEDSSDEEGAWEESGGRGEGDGAHELALRPRAHSLSSASSGEPDGERGDITPVPGAMRDAWRCSVAALLRHATQLPPMTLVHRLHTVLKEVTAKTISVCGSGGGAGGGELALVLERLAGEEPPLLWAGAAAADCARVRDAVRYAALEINEHLETYFDRREHALETLEVSRSAEETGRCLYKLIFQLLLLLETNNKMVVAVYHAALDNRGVEMSSAVGVVRAALSAHAADAWAEHSPSPAPHDDARLLQLMQRQRWGRIALSYNPVYRPPHYEWGAALALVRERNAERILERGELPEDDVTSLLHVYCRGLAQAHPDMVAITRPVNELSQNLSFMMESLYKVSVALQRQEFV